jgi:hypothetical protein
MEKKENGTESTHIFKSQIGALAPVEVQTVVKSTVTDQVQTYNCNSLNDHHELIRQIVNIFWLQRNPIGLVDHDHISQQRIERNEPNSRLTNKGEHALLEDDGHLLVQGLPLIEQVTLAHLAHLRLEAHAEDTVHDSIVLLVVEGIAYLLQVERVILHQLDEAVFVDDVQLLHLLHELLGLVLACFGVF